MPLLGKYKKPKTVSGRLPGLKTGSGGVTPAPRSSGRPPGGISPVPKPASSPPAGTRRSMPPKSQGPAHASPRSRHNRGAVPASPPTRRTIKPRSSGDPVTPKRGFPGETMKIFEGDLSSPRVKRARRVLAIARSRGK